MNLSDDDIRGNPIYKEELIKYRAKLDEDDRRIRVEEEKKHEIEIKKQKVRSIIYLVAIPVLGFMFIKLLLIPMINMLI